MAYREFANEPIYAGPDLTNVGNRTLSVMMHLNDQQARERQYRQQKAAQDLKDIQSFHANTTIPKYDRKLNDEAYGVTKRAHNDIMRTGVIQPQTKLQMERVKQM